VTPKAGDVVRHYKGGRYTVMAVAWSHEHNGDRVVIYVSHTNGMIFARPLESIDPAVDDWTDTVMWPDGIRRQRFITDDNDPKTLDHLFKKKKKRT
jgi:hypothetical protein